MKREGRVTWRREGEGWQPAAFAAKNLIIPFSTDSHKHFSSGNGNGFGNGFSPFLRLSGGRSDDAARRMQMEDGDSPLLKTRNEIQLTNCFLAAPSMSRHDRRGVADEICIRGAQLRLTRERGADEGGKRRRLPPVALAATNEFSRFVDRLNPIVRRVLLPFIWSVSATGEKEGETGELGWRQMSTAPELTVAKNNPARPVTIDETFEYYCPLMLGLDCLQTEFPRPLPPPFASS